MTKRGISLTPTVDAWPAFICTWANGLMADSLSSDCLPLGLPYCRKGRHQLMGVLVHILSKKFHSIDYQNPAVRADWRSVFFKICTQSGFEPEILHFRQLHILIPLVELRHNLRRSHAGERDVRVRVLALRVPLRRGRPLQRPAILQQRGDLSHQPRVSRAEAG